METGTTTLTPTLSVEFDSTYFERIIEQNNEIIENQMEMLEYYEKITVFLFEQAETWVDIPNHLLFVFQLLSAMFVLGVAYLLCLILYRFVLSFT